MAYADLPFGRRKKRRANMIWRARILGFICGLGLVVSSYTAGVMATDSIDGKLVMDERAILIYLVGPGAVLLFSVMGWFARGAYNTIDARLKRVEDTYVPKEVWKDWQDRWKEDVDRMIALRDREMDFIRDRIKETAIRNGNNGG